MACQDWHPPGSTAAPTPISPVSLWAHGAALLFRGQVVWTRVCRLTGHHLQCGSVQELRADTESLPHSPILLVPLKLAPGPKITAGKLGPWDHRPAPSPCASYPHPGRGTAERPCTHSVPTGAHLLQVPGSNLPLISGGTWKNHSHSHGLFPYLYGEVIRESQQRLNKVRHRKHLAAGR